LQSCGSVTRRTPGRTPPCLAAQHTHRRHSDYLAPAAHGRSGCRRGARGELRRAGRDRRTGLTGRGAHRCRADCRRPRPRLGSEPSSPVDDYRSAARYSPKMPTTGHILLVARCPPTPEPFTSTDPTVGRPLGTRLEMTSGLDQRPPDRASLLGREPDRCTPTCVAPGTDDSGEQDVMACVDHGHFVVDVVQTRTSVAGRPGRCGGVGHGWMAS
jgi:hypothetical protein